jgi:hypothetical protein
MGVEHGLYCVGCCWGLMLALFALGVMSLAWMTMIAAVIFAQKALPAGDRLAPLFAAAFVALGVWVAVSPGTVPGLHVPGQGAPAMQMGMSPFHDGASSPGCDGRFLARTQGVPVSADTGATEDAARGRPARPGGSVLHCERGS